MRWLVLLVVIAGCYAEPRPARRPTVVDNVPYGSDRAAVRAWHLAHDWCLRRTWPQSDEFVRCVAGEYINPTTPPMYTVIRYGSSGASVAYAVFVPVPCTMQGRCDRIEGAALPAERPFVDPRHGLDVDLAARGRAVQHPDAPLPDMQERMFDALAPELDARCGRPTWHDRYGATWHTRRTEVGLFVGGNGAWIIETHELEGAPPGIAFKD